MQKVLLSPSTENGENSIGSIDNDFDIDHTFNLDRFIESIESVQRHKPGGRAVLQELDCRALCVIVKQKFLHEKSILQLHAPIKVCGDIHGQIYDLIRIFDLCGHPSKQKYLFLGDYVDRGTASLDVISLLFAFKVKYPDNIYLLRGNHESICINRVYGFRKEISERFESIKAWKSFNVAFSAMPIAAMIEKSIFCCHGGISPNFMQSAVTDLIATINDIKRPTEVPNSGIMCDLLWSDPIESDNAQNKGGVPKGWIPNSRGCSFAFGFDIVESFLDKFKLDLIVRAHQVVPDGYEFYCDGSLVTIFSASNYCGTFDNAAGVFNLEPSSVQPDPHDVSLNGGFHILPPDKSMKNVWIKSKKKEREKEVEKEKEKSTKKKEKVGINQGLSLIHS